PVWLSPPLRAGRLAQAGSGRVRGGAPQPDAPGCAAPTSPAHHRGASPPHRPCPAGGSRFGLLVSPAGRPQALRLSRQRLSCPAGVARALPGGLLHAFPLAALGATSKSLCGYELHEKLRSSFGPEKVEYSVFSTRRRVFFACGGRVGTLWGG